jgi:hypothetical protein
MDLNKNNFWSKKTYTLPTEVDYLYERLQKSKDYSLIQKVLGSTFPGSTADVSYFDVLKEKVITAQNATISESQNRTRQLQALVKEATGGGGVNPNDDLTEEAMAVQEQINFQTQVKFLQMYFDSYMAPKVSDAEWRLGKVTGTVLNTDMPSTGQTQGGLMYTRSAFSFPFYRKYWDYGLIGGNGKDDFKTVFGNIFSSLVTIQENLNELEKLWDIENSSELSGLIYGSTTETLSGEIFGIISGRVSGIVSGEVSSIISGIVYGDTSGLISGEISGFVSGPISGIVDITTTEGTFSGLLEKYVSMVVSGFSSGYVSGESSGIISGFASGIVYTRVNGVVSGEVSKNVSGEFSSLTSGILSGIIFGSPTIEVSGVGYGLLSNIFTESVSDLLSGEIPYTILGNISGNFSGDISGISRGYYSGLASGEISGIANSIEDLIFEDQPGRITSEYFEISGVISGIVRNYGNILTSGLASNRITDTVSGENGILLLSGIFSGPISGGFSKFVSGEISGILSLDINIDSSVSGLLNGIDLLDYFTTSLNDKISGVLTDISGNFSGILSGEAELKNIDMSESSALLSVSGIIFNLRNDLNSFMSGITVNLNNPEIFSTENLFKMVAINGIKQKREYYSTLFFPPYKISPNNGIGDFTQYMNDIYARNPGASFDIDSFYLRKEGFTYRDPGFKSLSDYINYLQWVIEGATGIVHTYFTEWDLSLYLQENMLSATINGAPLKMYLNYRIRQDNPLASGDEINVSTSSAGGNVGAAGSAAVGKYTDDRALVFNVAGSAVSKIDFDNQKLWRPSDFPLSAWWLPYLRGKDWKMKVFETKDYMMEKQIPYMDIYDTVNAEFEYETAKLKDVFKNQDYLGAIMGIWPNFNMKYYQAVYTSPLDGHSDYDIKTYGDLGKVAGADYGVAAAKKKALNDFVKTAKKEMLLNEGYYGHVPTLAGQATRYDYFDDGASDSEKMTFSGMKRKQSAAKDKALSDIDLEQPFAGGSSKAADMLSSGLNNKVDASSMTNFTGINRFSPALFGGPHGSDYNPSTLQAYFDVNNQFLRNIARIDPSQAKDKEQNSFRSDTDDDYYQGLNALYDNGTKTGVSPTRALSHLVKGITAYTIDYAYQEVERTRVWVTVPSYFWYPKETKQGYTYKWYEPNDERLVNVEDKTIQRETEKYIKVPFNIGNAEYRDGGWYIKKVVYEKLADYSEMAMVPYKKYIFHDEPDIEWEIIQHKFEGYTADNSSLSSAYWQSVNWVFSQAAQDQFKDYKKELNNLTKQFNPVFVLKFWQRGATPQHSDPEKKIRETLIAQDGKPVSLFFLEGNNDNRLDTGPESIFRATCSIDYYRDVQEHFVETSLFGMFKKKKKTGEYYNYVPFIKVDIPDSDLIADDLQYKGYSNIDESGIQNPMHLNSTLWTDRDIKIHILQKFKRTNVPNTMTSFKSTKTETRDFAAIAAIALAILLPGAATLALMIYTLVKGPSMGGGMDKNYDDSLPKDVNWTSSATLRISGKGIMSQFKGLNPDAKDITVKNTTYYYRDNLKLDAGQEDTPFKNLVMKVSDYPSGTSEMDSGLQKALLNVYLRPRMMLQKESTLVHYSYTPLDTPIRNFLSILLTQISYYQFIKSSLLGENETESLINLNILYRTLTMCVDKCILKASGLNGENVRVTPDRNHIYYDYWIDQVIQILYGTDLDRQAKKIEIKSVLQEKINIIQATIDVLHPICLKNIEDWTLNEVITSLNHIAAIKELDKTTVLEKFLFGYLRILYYYRFFFIAKRFNKENGSMWVMRALESVLEFIVPTAPSSGPPPSPSEMTKKEPVYNVSFHEVQNTTYAKQQAIINQTSLDPDRITKVYVRVQWCTKDDYDKYYPNGPDGEPDTNYDEVVEIIRNGVSKYAFKPIDGTYTLISKEFLTNDKDIKWNNLHPLEIQRIVKDYDIAQWFITWEDSPNLTPIRWDVFGEINVNNLLQYAPESISPDEYVCLMEQGADFWTVPIPESMHPRAEGYQTKIRLKQYVPISAENMANDPMINVVGPIAYSLYPIIATQERPYPGASSDNPIMSRLMSDGIGGF